MMLRTGEKIFIVTRRLFEEDLKRHFVGEVLDCSEFAVKAKGYIFGYDNMSGNFMKREEIRTRIDSLTDAGLIINVLPFDVNLAEISYHHDEKNQRILTDGKTFKMNVSEFAIQG